VQDQDDPFDYGELLGEIGIKDNGEEADGDHKKSALPSLENIGGVVDDHETLDLGCCEECNTGNTGLPSQHADPSCNVAQELLSRLGSEFGYPVVLTSCRRSH
jgi:hypothetical protein